ncbi:uncharacterized protein [Panulirus ornatus]|uniref:uncharacterized protein isoform X2 n=1 Tax=Panulirus ornatus TaxID=150431 RepID=UPI003A84100F
MSRRGSGPTCSSPSRISRVSFVSSSGPPASPFRTKHCCRCSEVDLESLKEKEWKQQQEESSGQRTNMFLTLQDLQCIFYILVWAACIAATNQALLDVLRDGVTEGEGLEAAAT